MEKVVVKPIIYEFWKKSAKSFPVVLIMPSGSQFTIVLREDIFACILCICVYSFKN